MRRSLPNSINWSTYAISMPFIQTTPSDPRYLILIFTDPSDLGSWPRLQGLRSGRPSDASCFHVHRYDSVLRIPPHYNACWTSAPTARTFIWSFEDALSTGTILYQSNFLGLISLNCHLGFRMVCNGGHCRGTYSGERGLIEGAFHC